MKLQYFSYTMKYLITSLTYKVLNISCTSNRVCECNFTLQEPITVHVLSLYVTGGQYPVHTPLIYVYIVCMHHWQWSLLISNKHFNVSWSYTQPTTNITIQIISDEHKNRFNTMPQRAREMACAHVTIFG